VRCVREERSGLDDSFSKRLRKGIHSAVSTGRNILVRQKESCGIMPSSVCISLNDPSTDSGRDMNGKETCLGPSRRSVVEELSRVIEVS